MIIETCPKCGHNLYSLVLTSYPPIYKKECHNCGWSLSEREEVIKVPFVEDRKEVVKDRIGMLVYPVICKEISNGFEQVQLFGKGVFFTDQNEGWKYQEKMNRLDDKYDFWSNNLMPYDIQN